MRHPKDLTGMRFGGLLVLEHVNAGEPGETQWLCRCDCGETLVKRRKLLTGGVESCNSCARKRSVLAQTQHGLSKTPEYAAWNRMRQRCLNPNTEHYPNYGGRGIRFCDRWQTFENFLADMGHKPAGQSLDRIDNEKDYSPENCRWADDFEQARNRRNVRLFDVGGRMVCVSEMALGAAVGRSSVRKRLLKGWDPERAIEAPPSHGKRGAR